MFAYSPHGLQVHSIIRKLLMPDPNSHQTLIHLAENERILAPRGEFDIPISMLPAIYDNHRSVRIMMPQGDIGLATSTYSYNLTQEERQAVARRIAALWNFAEAQSLTTEELESLATNYGDRTK